MDLCLCTSPCCFSTPWFSGAFWPWYLYCCLSLSCFLTCPSSLRTEDLLLVFLGTIYWFTGDPFLDLGVALFSWNTNTWPLVSFWGIGGRTSLYVGSLEGLLAALDFEAENICSFLVVIHSCLTSLLIRKPYWGNSKLMLTLEAGGAGFSLSSDNKKGSGIFFLGAHQLFRNIVYVGLLDYSRNIAIVLILFTVSKVTVLLLVKHLACILYWSKELWALPIYYKWLKVIALEMTEAKWTEV